MAKCKLDEPFTIYRVLPRAPIPFSDTTTLASLDVDGSLLTHELNRDVDFFEFFRGLVRTSGF